MLGGPEFLSVGSDARQIAVLRRAGRAPGLFWLSGYRSEMVGTKAEALDALGAEMDLAVTRFDYSGHGQSGGDFLKGTISRWLEEALAVFQTTKGPQIIVGSSIGGWIALLLARALRRAAPDRVKALILIAPAVDATAELMEKRLTAAEQHVLQRDGVVYRASQYSETPYPYTRALIEDGRNHLLFGRGIETGCPVTILQGARDPDVPPAHAMKLVQHLLIDPTTLTLVPDGDHRLSRESDLALLRDAVKRQVGAPAQQLRLEL